MGCVASKEATDNEPVTSSVGGTHFPNFTKPRAFLVKPALTVSELAAKREEFWHTSPSYGGAREIWDVLKAAVDAQDIETARLFVESADIIVALPDMSVCYDVRGGRYEIPKWVMADPSNLRPDPPGTRRSEDDDRTAERGNASPPLSPGTIAIAA